RNIAWCLVDGITPNARSLLFPADFTYIRWNRSGMPFEGFADIQYDRSETLDWWTDVLRRLPAQVKTVYGYMANEFAGHAPTSLRMLSERLGLNCADPQSLWPQQALFQSATSRTTVWESGRSARNRLLRGLCNP